MNDAPRLIEDFLPIQAKHRGAKSQERDRGREVFYEVSVEAIMEAGRCLLEQPGPAKGGHRKILQ